MMKRLFLCLLLCSCGGSAETGEDRTADATTDPSVEALAEEAADDVATEVLADAGTDPLEEDATCEHWCSSVVACCDQPEE